MKRINRQAPTLRALPDRKLAERFQALKPEVSRLSENGQTTPDDMLIERAFPLIREAGRRALGMEHYDVQLHAGIVMVRGGVAEMATGEGKTLVATLPASLFALWGRGVHVMTVNAYLARRDVELMRPVYSLLGLSVGHIETNMPEAQKRNAYCSDITYGVGNDFGFDYLRDQLVLQSLPVTAIGSSYLETLRGKSPSVRRAIQGKLAFAVVDEADSVMIDEASTSLILSGSSGQAHPHPEPYLLAFSVAANFQEGEHYQFDSVERIVTLTEKAVHQGLASLDRDTRFKLTRPWEAYISKAIYARLLSERDVDYIVKDGKVQIIDAATGRRFEDRTWSGGLHQAVEAKEGLVITEESAARLKMSRQRFFGLYERLCGMTGTAFGCEQEFTKFFDMKVGAVPLHRPSKRRVLPLRFFDNRQSKWNAILAEVRRIHRTGAPVLVGTQSVRDSEHLAERLAETGLVARVLNARYDDEEAELVAQAGKQHAITVATNMAGRGTDIPVVKEVCELGGLFVILTEPHVSHRIDRQLIGRCARQGQPGTAVVFSCTEDHLFVTAGFKHWSGMRLGDSWLTEKLNGKIRSLQARLDQDAFMSRTQLLRQDNWKESLIRKLS